MTVKIVTDSGCDMSMEMAKKLGIAMVPVYIYFGDKCYKDLVEISPEELYKRLVEGPVYPTTTQPIPKDFAEVYKEVSKDADAIVSIHLSSKVSGTYNAALQGVEMSNCKCDVHVIDSGTLAAGLGLVVLAANRVAGSGAKVAEVLDVTRNAMAKTQLRGLLETLQYLLKGGRITKTKALVGTLLNVKPILKTQDGELVQAGMARSYAKGMDQLFEFLRKYPDLEELAISYTTVKEQAEALRQRLTSIIDEKRIHMLRVSAGLGVHGGPGTLIVAARGH